MPLTICKQPQAIAQVRRQPASATWMEKITADGVPYYYDSSNDAVSWEKPDALKSADELEKDSGEWAWVADPEQAWVPAKVVSRSSGSVQVQLQSGTRKTVDPRQVSLRSTTRVRGKVCASELSNDLCRSHCGLLHYRV
jgi:hypothetical protein